MFNGNRKLNNFVREVIYRNFYHKLGFYNPLSAPVFFEKKQVKVKTKKRYVDKTRKKYEISVSIYPYYEDLLDNNIKGVSVSFLLEYSSFFGDPFDYREKTQNYLKKIIGTSVGNPLEEEISIKFMIEYLRKYTQKRNLKIPFSTIFIIARATYTFITDPGYVIYTIHLPEGLDNCIAKLASRTSYFYTLEQVLEKCGNTISGKEYIRYIYSLNF